LRASGTCLLILGKSGLSSKRYQSMLESTVL